MNKRALELNGGDDHHFLIERGGEKDVERGLLDAQERLVGVVFLINGEIPDDDSPPGAEMDFTQGYRAVEKFPRPEDDKAFERVRQKDIFEEKVEGAAE